MGSRCTDCSAETFPMRYQNACWARTSVPSTNQLKLLACVAVSNWATELPSVNVKSAAHAGCMTNPPKPVTIARLQRPRKAAQRRDVQPMGALQPWCELPSYPALQLINIAQVAF